MFILKLMKLSWTGFVQIKYANKYFILYTVRFYLPSLMAIAIEYIHYIRPSDNSM